MPIFIIGGQIDTPHGPGAGAERCRTAQYGHDLLTAGEAAPAVEVPGGPAEASDTGDP